MQAAPRAAALAVRCALRGQRQWLSRSNASAAAAVPAPTQAQMGVNVDAGELFGGSRGMEAADVVDEDLFADAALEEAGLDADDADESFADEAYDEAMSAGVWRESPYATSKARTTSPSPAALDAAGLQEYMKQYFGHTDFRPHQLELIQAVLSGRDGVAVLPAAHGKSLCYQLPATVLKEPVLVIAPTTSLMEEQVELLMSRGIDAAYSGRMGSAYRQKWERMDVVFMTPEAAVSQRDRLARTKFGLIVIDEAQCIWDMGRSFRRAYARLGFLREMHPATPILALTATAPPRVMDAITETLQLSDPHVAVMSSDRPLLHYSVQPMGRHTMRQIHAIARDETCVLIYCMTAADCNTVYDWLRAKGDVEVGKYHSQMEEDEKVQFHKDFAMGNISVMVCTAAYGLGLDKEDVRHVVHYGFTRSLVEYYQQTSRAGRDGLRAQCTMFVPALRCMSSVVTPMNGVAKRWSDKKLLAHRQQALRDLADLVEFVEADPKVCRRVPLLEHLGESYTTPAAGCGACDHCDGGLARVEQRKKLDITDIARDLLGIVRYFAPEPTTIYMVTRVYFGDTPKHTPTLLTDKNGTAAREARRKYMATRLDAAARCPYHGAGQRHTKEYVKAVLTQLVQEGYLRNNLSYAVKEKRGVSGNKSTWTGMLSWGYTMTAKGDRTFAALTKSRGQAKRRVRVTPNGAMLAALGRSPFRSVLDTADAEDSADLPLLGLVDDTIMYSIDGGVLPDTAARASDA